MAKHDERELGFDLSVELIAVDAEVGGGVLGADRAGEQD